MPQPRTIFVGKCDKKSEQIIECNGKGGTIKLDLVPTGLTVSYLPNLMGNPSCKFSSQHLSSD